MARRHRAMRLAEPTGGELERLRRAYADRSITVGDIRRRFRFSDESLRDLVVRQGWPLRRAAHHTKAAEEGTTA